MFYGWVAVAISFATQFLLAGCVFYVFGVLFKDLAADFQSGRLGISGIQMVMPWTGALIAPFVGRLAGRGHLRILITLGCLSTGLGLILSSKATELWQLYLIFSTFITLGANTMSGVCAAALVVNWFSRSRALALGISQIGASAGGMVLGPIAATLLGDFGWRGIYQLFGVVILICVPLVWYFTVGHPRDRGVAADGNPPEDSSAEAGQEAAPAFDTRAALRDHNLWFIAFATGVGFMISSSLVTHAVALATDAGVSPLRASWLLSLIAGGAVLGKVLFGSLADRVGERPAFYVSLLMQVAGLMAVMAVSGESALFACMGFLGLGLGGVLPLSAALAARVFGPAAFAPIMGLMMPLITPIVSAGTPFAGFIFDATGSYDLAFMVFSGALLAACVSLSRVQLPPAENPAREAASPRRGESAPIENS